MRPLSWAMLSVGAFLRAISAAFTVYFQMRELPSPLIWNITGPVFTLSGVALAVGAGMLIDSRRRVRADGVLSVMIVVSSIALCSLLEAFLHGFSLTSISGVPGIYCLAFCVLDFLLLAACVFLFDDMAATTGCHRSGLLVAVGGLALVGGDTSYFLVHLHDGNIATLLGEVLWIAAFFLIGVGAMWSREGNTEDPDSMVKAGPFWQFVTSLVPVFACVMILVRDYRSDTGFVLQSLLACFALVVLFVIRQAFILAQYVTLLRDNSNIAARLSRFNDDLEATVKKRTRYLESLQSITAEACSSLEQDKVLRICAEGCRQAINADGCGVWVQRDSRPVFLCGSEPTPEALEHIESMRQNGCRAGHSTPPESTVLCGGFEDSKGRGCLLSWRAGSVFTDEECALVAAIAAELGSALCNAQAHALAAEAADRDPLTGLLNNKAFHARLKTEVARALRDARPVAVVMLDLDDFKMFNDTFGHPVGDEVLRYVSQILRECTRSFDIAARYGGDEFALVLPASDAYSATAIAERVCSAIYQNGLRHNGEDIPLCMCYGISVYPDGGLTAAELLAQADMRLYQAKNRRGGLKLAEKSRQELGSQPGFDTLDALIAAVDSRDRFARQHSEEVACYAEDIARELRWKPEHINQLRVAALLHDVGKVGLKENLLRRPGKLEPEEFEAMKSHTSIGGMLVRSVHGSAMARQVAEFHHERWDGSGYPRGLREQDIPIAARIISVADAYSAMTTHRPYRRAMDEPEALALLKRGAGTQWDPLVVDAFVSSLGKRHALSTEPNCIAALAA